MQSVLLNPMAEFRPYPSVRYHISGKEVVVKNPDEDKALRGEGGWAGSPDAFKPYQGARTLLLEHDPVKWVDEWWVEGLTEHLREKVKGALLHAHGSFWRQPDSPNADTTAMTLAFSGVAQVLFEAGLLNPKLLENEIPELIWDSAIAGGWWRFASETPQEMFVHKLGRYWVWLDESRNLGQLFTPEAAAWRAKLIEMRDRRRRTADALFMITSTTGERHRRVDTGVKRRATTVSPLNLN